ncbi:MAG: protein kinase [Gemmatimonadota bacterium]|nr:MAG: protein kinase [Gemmatimonadota bacterium]
MAEIPDRLESALADRYPLQRELGSGGMATVYLARDLKHERDVALKVLRPEYTAGLGTARFLREIGIAASMTHPHILPLYDSGEVEGLVYYVMPYVEGESLRGRLRREGQLPIDDAVQITRQVADALSYSHKHGVIHRDIKPENVLLEEGEAVVADFGVARAITAAASDEMTASGVVVGTPHYMSPEQGSGEHELDARTDVYSLGCVLYEMLAGEPPFTGPTAQAVIARHVSEHPPSLRVVRPAVPTWLERVTQTALAKNPVDRYPTAEAFSRALAAHKEPRRLRLRLFPKNRRRRVILGVASAAIIAAAILAEALDLRVGLGDEGPLPPPESRSIAVLYFEDRSADGSLGTLARGLTEDLIERLRGVPILNVMSRSAVLAFADRPIRPDSVRSVLGVEFVIAGFVEPMNGDIRVTIDISDAVTNELEAQFAVERPASEPLALREELTDMLARSLHQMFGREIVQARQRDEATNDSAWALFQRAIGLRRDATQLSGGDPAAASLRSAHADSLLAEAERLDRAWLAPTLERGWIAADQSVIALLADPDSVERQIAFNSWIDRGIEHSERALERQPEYAEALELRGFLKFRCVRYCQDEHGDTLLHAALQDLEAATRADTSLVRAWIALSQIYSWQGRDSEASLAAEKAIRADVYAQGLRHVLMNSFMNALNLGDLEAARQDCGLALRHYPDAPDVQHCELAILSRFAASPDDVQRASQLLDSLPSNDAFPFRPLYYAAVLARTGQADSALSVIEHTREASSDEGVRSRLIPMEAWVLTLIGDHDRAVALLLEHLTRYPQTCTQIRTHWYFQDLHDHPRFQALCETSSADAPSG